MGKTPKRIVFGVAEAEHKTIKQKAVACGVTMQRYIMQAIFQRINRENAITDGSQTPKKCRC